MMRHHKYQHIHHNNVVVYYNKNYKMCCVKYLLMVLGVMLLGLLNGVACQGKKVINHFSVSSIFYYLSL